VCSRAPLLSQGRGRTSFSVTFEQQRLGMVLQDVFDTQSSGNGKSTSDSSIRSADPPEAVEVGAFTVGPSGELGAAEVGGQVKIGDRITRVDVQSCLGLNYAAVLDLVVSAQRPVTLHFERLASKPGMAGVTTGAAAKAAAEDDPAAPARVPHEEWIRPSPAP
jgi:hypothetical protein